MLGSRAIGSRARGLSPHTRDLAVDSPCPPQLSKREHCHCALHALLLFVYQRMLGRASREHLSGGDPLLHTICALPVLLSIYKRVVGRASREHLSGGDPLWYTTCALHALLSVGRASREHLSGGDPLLHTCTSA